MGLESYQIFNLILTGIVTVAILIGVVVYFVYIHRVFSSLSMEVRRAVDEMRRVRAENSADVNGLLEKLNSSPLLNEELTKLQIMDAVRQGIFESIAGPQGTVSSAPPRGKVGVWQQPRPGNQQSTRPVDDQDNVLKF